MFGEKRRIGRPENEKLGVNTVVLGQSCQVWDAGQLGRKNRKRSNMSFE